MPYGFGYSPHALYDPVAAYYAWAHGYGMFDPAAAYYPSPQHQQSGVDPGVGYYDATQMGVDPYSPYGSVGYPAPGYQQGSGQQPWPSGQTAEGTGEYERYPGEQWTGGGGDPEGGFGR